MGSAGKKLRTRMDIGKDIQSCLDDLNNMTHESKMKILFHEAKNEDGADFDTHACPAEECPA